MNFKTENNILFFQKTFICHKKFKHILIFEI